MVKKKESRLYEILPRLLLSAHSDLIIISNVDAAEDNTAV